MKQNATIAEQIRRNPLSQSLSSLNKRGVSIDSFRNNQRTIDSFRSPVSLGPKTIIDLESEVNNHSINRTITPSEQSPLSKSKKSPKLLLPSQSPKDSGKKTLVLDLDETLIHSDFSKYKDKADIMLTVTVDNKKTNVYVLIRPGTDVFLSKMAQCFELVVFTASIAKYAQPLMNKLDQKKLISHTLYREHCTIINNAGVKDLKKLNRDMKNVIMLDNNPLCYSLDPENGFPIKSWLDDQNDRELFKLIPILQFLAEVPDVRDYISSMQDKNIFSYTKAANIMNSYYSNKKRANELSKSVHYQPRLNEDNIAFFNSTNGSSNRNEEHLKSKATMSKARYLLSIDPVVKENVNTNDCIKKPLPSEESTNHHRKNKNARHQYNMSDSKVTFIDKKYGYAQETSENDSKAKVNYHTKHVSIELDKDNSSSVLLNKTTKAEDIGYCPSMSINQNKSNSSAESVKQKVCVGTTRDINQHVGLNWINNNRQSGNDQMNIADTSKETYNNFLMSNQNKSKLSSISNPYSLRQNLNYLKQLNDNEKKILKEVDSNKQERVSYYKV